MKRLKKILKWSGIVLAGLVAILLVANAWFVWTTDTRLERQLQDIRDAGDPLTLAELARPPIPPEKNATTYLRRAEADVAAIEKATADLPGVYQYPGRPMSSGDQEKVKAAFDAYANAIPLLEQAATCPDYDEQLDYTVSAQQFTSQLIDLVNKNHPTARVLRARAMLQVAEGKRNEAVQTALMIFRLARHFDRNPAIINYLVANAVRGIAIDSVNVSLQTGPVSNDVRDALDAELARQERMDQYAWALKSDRAFGLDSLRAFPLRNFWLLSRGFWNRIESEYLDEMQALVTLTRDPHPFAKQRKSSTRSVKGLLIQ